MAGVKAVNLHTGVVLMPGSTLPLKLSDPAELSVLHLALHQPPPTTRLVVVVSGQERKDVEAPYQRVEKPLQRV